MTTTSSADLERQVASLTQQVAELRSLLGDRQQPAAVPAGAVAAETSGSRVSRRGLLTSLPGLAVAGAGAMALSGLTASPAAAGVGDPVLQGMNNNAGASTTTLTSTKPIAWNVSTGMKSKTLHVGEGAVNDQGDLSVLTHKAYTAFVECRQQISSAGDKGGSAIYADGFMAPAIVIDAREGLPKGQADPNDVKPGLGIAVRGHDSSPGIEVATQLATIFAGVQSDSKTKVNGATIITHGLGRGLLVESVNKANATATLTGANAGPGIGVVGIGSSTGRGGQFSGGKANVRLLPHASKSHPATGAVGDLFVDATHRLWFCKGGATWALVV